jgi:hypothetical protein
MGGKGGDAKGDAAVAAGGEAVVQPSALLQEPRFAPFLATDFNAAEFTSRVLSSSQTTALVKSEELKESLRLLQAELAGIVTRAQPALLAHARRAAGAQAELQASCSCRRH